MKILFQRVLGQIRTSLQSDVWVVRLNRLEAHRGVGTLIGVSRNAHRATLRVWDILVDYFLRLKVRVKLSVIVGVSIVAVTFIISSVAVSIQEREIRKQIMILGTNLVQSLTNVAEDNLLLNSIPVLQDYLKNFGKRNIPGLEHLYVVDRNGVIVADIIPDSIQHPISRAEWDVLTAADTVSMVETAGQFRFVQAVYIRAHDRGHTRRILLGSSSATFSKAVLLRPVEEMKGTILLASVLVSVVAIGLVFFVSKRIVHVIIVLSDAARRVGTGDLQVTVATRVKDEIGMLAKEFNLMVVQIRQKIEMQKFVSRSTVEMIAKRESATLGGERKEIAVLFTDVRNFTSYAEKHSPEEVVETLNEYLNLQTRVIDEHHGVVDKFIGDGVMSVFAGEHMVEHAVAAALRIQDRIATMNEHRRKQGSDVLQVGAGIAAGVAILGSIGSQNRMDFTAIGDTVNLASRLCGLAGPSEVLLTAEVAGRVRHEHRVRSGGKMSIKGKQDQVEIYRLSDGN